MLRMQRHPWATLALGEPTLVWHAYLPMRLGFPGYFEKPQTHHKKSCYQIGFAWTIPELDTPLNCNSIIHNNYKHNKVHCNCRIWPNSFIMGLCFIIERAKRAMVDLLSKNKGHYIRGELDHMGRLDGLDELHNLVGMILAHSQMRQC